MGRKGLLNKLFDLSGEVAVVTGASGNLGPVWIESLLDAGAAVFALDQPGAILNDKYQNLQNHFGKQRLVLIGPWLDYDPATFDRVWPRAEYKQRIQEAARLIRQAAPEAKVRGCIETDWVALYPDRIKITVGMATCGRAAGAMQVYDALAERIEAFKNGGMGLYPSHGFVHVDVRGHRSRWAKLHGRSVSVAEAMKSEGGEGNGTV